MTLKLFQMLAWCFALENFNQKDWNLMQDKHVLGDFIDSLKVICQGAKVLVYFVMLECAL